MRTLDAHFAFLETKGITNFNKQRGKERNVYTCRWLSTIDKAISIICVQGAMAHTFRNCNTCWSWPDPDGGVYRYLWDPSKGYFNIQNTSFVRETKTFDRINAEGQLTLLNTYVRTEFLQVIQGFFVITLTLIRYERKRKSYGLCLFRFFKCHIQSTMHTFVYYCKEILLAVIQLRWFQS